MPEPGPSAVGLLIRKRRLALDLSRGELARRARVSLSTMKNAENGKHAPTLATLAALAGPLELPDLAGPRAPVL